MEEMQEIVEELIDVRAALSHSFSRGGNEGVTTGGTPTGSM